MEEVDLQLLNAVNGFCEPGASDQVAYLKWLNDLLDAFNSVMTSCGANGACIADTKQLSHRVKRQSTDLLSTRKTRNDVAALLFLFPR